jgi:hypothetical protein
MAKMLTTAAAKMEDGDSVSQITKVLARSGLAALPAPACLGFRILCIRHRRVLINEIVSGVQGMNKLALHFVY